MASNPPSVVPVVQRPPTRIVASDTQTLAATGSSGSTQAFPGSNNRQDRLQFVVTNLDLQNSIKLQTLNGKNFATVPPQQSFNLETSADFQLANLNATQISYEVCEIYPDIGNFNLPMRLAVQAQPGGTPAPGGGTGGGAPAGGGTGGTSGGGGFSGGSGGGRSGGTQLH